MTIPFIVLWRLRADLRLHSPMRLHDMRRYGEYTFYLTLPEYHVTATLNVTE